MEEDVLNALQTRTAFIPGSFDRDGKIIFIVNIASDLQNWQQKSLNLSITYLKRSLSDVILQNGVTVIVDAQKTTVRINRQHARFIYSLFEGLTVNLYLVKSEGFWEKHVETCTKSQTKGEPIVLSRSRLVKYFDVSSLPEELGGHLQFNYDLWLQLRKSIDEFVKFYDNCLSAMESFQKLLQSNKSIRVAEANAELKKNSQLHATVQCSIETAIEMGNRILTRFNEVYSPTPPLNTNRNITNATSNKTSHTTTKATTINDHDIHTPVATTNGLIKCILPPDLNCERSRIEMRLNEIERRQTDLRTCWLELIQTVREARELATLEEGVAFVTNWILSTAEQMLNRQTAIGCDVKACENLRSAHDNLELECRETYGFYAELLYKIETYSGSKDTAAFKDLLSQKDFMQFVCRSFATRLERRRNILITSLRFYRLVTEYFEKTTEVFESLVMGGCGGSGGKIQDFTQASGTLKKLKSSQQSLSSIERELIKEGEKLSDILSMPVKDALGRDLHIDYSDDICSVREILDTTLARRKIFSDSVELQKLTLEQVTHIYTYEQDACMAIKWLDDLYNVMIKCHSHVGCNIHEIQVQKDELQTFQETGKSIFNYGCQLLEASKTLRSTCKLEVTEALKMQQQLEKTWHSLQAISQEHMTRLRVSAVFHRSVEDYCQQLIELRRSLHTMLQQQQTQLRQQQRSSSSGISSESESQAQSPSTNAGEDATRFCHSMMQQTHTLLKRAVDNNHQLHEHNDEDDDEDAASEKSINEQRELLRKCLMEREKLLVEVGRMVRLGRLLKTRLKEPFVLDAATGKSIVVEDLPSEITTSSPTVESTISGSSSNTSNFDCSPISETVDPSKIIIHPIHSNGLACNAITNKLSDIAEVAESLDAVIRDVQENVQLVEVELTSSPSHKKLSTLRSTSSEDWHSRSTEDDSFATASEGNFTPSSSSYQTASGRTSSYISCDKNSFDASEADDSTFAFEMPELTSPLNISYEGSEQSYLSTQPPNNPSLVQVEHKIPSKLRENINNSSQPIEEDQNSTADIAELHSESVTPTPEDHYEGYHNEGIPIDSESESEIAGIANVPSMTIITEHTSMPLSRTPEVSASASNTSSNPNTITTHMTVNLARDSNEQQELQISNSSTNNNNIKPNAAWRRSKYYENITKQTIKGFL